MQVMKSTGKHPVTMILNGKRRSGQTEPRTLLSDFLRHELGVTGTHVGCEHGVCGACTIQMDGLPVRACLTLAVQANGREVRTVEDLASMSESGSLRLSQLQRSFRQNHALQCGFCTAGILMTLDVFLAAKPDPTEAEIREELSGHICRCTGYTGIVNAALEAAVSFRSSNKKSVEA